jgi:uncharacterized lipoprotein YmbA
MKFLRRQFCLLLIVGLGACASSPPLRYYALDDGRPMAVGLPEGVSVAIMRVNLPELVDRPQLVVRSVGHRVQISDGDRWVEPLRRQVPRLLARDLGVALDSGRVVALGADIREFDTDFRVVVDVQQLEVVMDQRVELDAVWRVEQRNGRAIFGRSQVVQGLGDKAAPNGYAAAVNAQRTAFGTLAKNIATKISAQLETGDLPSSHNNDPQGSPRLRRMSDHQL